MDFRVSPLQNNSDVAGNSLVFGLPAGNFLKHIDIFGSYDGEKWDFVLTDYIFRADGREKKTVALGGTKKYTYYRTVIVDNPENITFKGMQLHNHYTDNKWNQYLKTTQVGFEIKTEKNLSVITIDNKQKLAIKKIILEVEDNFQRTYYLYRENKSGLIKSGEIYNLQLKNVQVSGTTIDLSGSPITTAQPILKIDNRDDRPLTIKSIKIEYYLDKLVFPNMGNTPYRLYFGNTKADKPRYEIELQKTYIEREPQDICQLGNMEATPQKSAEDNGTKINTRYIFNGIIIGVSLLLVVTIVTRLNSKQ